MIIEGKIAIVTGGASGLGEGTVRVLTEKGAKVAIFDLNIDKAKAIADELGSEKALAVEVDVTREESVANALEVTCEQFGNPSICCNFAGYGIGVKTFGSKGVHPLDAYRNLIDVNLVGTFNVCRLVAESMSKLVPYNDDGARGVIINTASGAAFEGQMGQVAYSASKAGVVGMTLPMARDLSALGIRVNAISPGLIHTPIIDTMPQPVLDQLVHNMMQPRRLGKPREVGELVAMIAESEYLNGENIRLDGAARMPAR